MFRFRLNDLNTWLASANRNPLVMRGARQVGKTWLVREFAKVNNLQLLEINFELDNSSKQLFDSNDPQQIIKQLEISLGKTIVINNSLLFLDEIQACPEILAKLRWFKELLPELAVIVAGSLLEFVLNDHDFSMPVGRISYFHLEPMSFEEFVFAKNQQFWEFLTEYNWQEIPDTIHQQGLRYLQEYTIVGGLPAVVSNYLAENSLLPVQQIQRDLITTYCDDFIKYKQKYPRHLFDDVFNYVHHNLGAKIVYSHINNHYRIADLKTVVNLLTQARIICSVKASAGNGVPLAAEINNKYSKLISLDIGLMNNILGINLHSFKNIDDLDFINKGAIAEQLVGQSLRTIGPYYMFPDLYYWQRNHPGSNAEIDYLLQHNGKVIPIEVKAGTKGTMQSLHLFMHLKKLSTAIRLNCNLPNKTTITAKVYTGEEVNYQLLSLPLYLAGQLNRFLLD
jgi:predicted AAA+ superfamily ATPase